MLSFIRDETCCRVNANRLDAIIPRPRQVGETANGSYPWYRRQTSRVGAGHPGGTMATTQDDMIAELQRANAELRQERDAALSQKAALTEERAENAAALAQRNSEYGERTDHQAATIDV